MLSCASAQQTLCKCTANPTQSLIHSTPSINILNVAKSTSELLTLTAPSYSFTASRKPDTRLRPRRPQHEHKSRQMNNGIPFFNATPCHCKLKKFRSDRSHIMDYSHSLMRLLTGRYRYRSVPSGCLLHMLLRHYWVALNL